jgi:ankyrin repeat protein
MTDAEAIVQAAKTGDLERVRDLIRSNGALAGARLSNGETPLMAALYRGHRDIVDLLAAELPELDIFAASAIGRLPDLRRAIAQPDAVARVSYDGWTPLHLAAFFGQLEAVERLLVAGADLQALSTNSLRNTALHAATAGGHAKVALLLIDRGANVNVADAGAHTPLHIAAEAGLVDVARGLLARGADPHAVDAEDKTPLARAAARNQTAIVDLINETR